NGRLPQLYAQESLKILDANLVPLLITRLKFERPLSTVTPSLAMKRSVWKEFRDFVGRIAREKRDQQEQGNNNNKPRWHNNNNGDRGGWRGRGGGGRGRGGAFSIRGRGGRGPMVLHRGGGGGGDDLTKN